MSDLCPFDVTPLATPRVINNLPVYSLNYTNQDYNSIKNRVIELLKTNYGENFNDINEASLAMMLIECWAGMADMLSFKIDQLANEFFIDTVTELENAFRIAKLVGYKPIPPLPAKAMFVATVNHVYSQDLFLKTPITLDLEESGLDVTYELFAADANNNPVFDTDIVIPAGSLFTEHIVGVEGITRTYSYKSDGRANQIFTLPNENAFFGSVRVVVNGLLWEQVEYFTESKQKPEYMLEYNAYYKPSIIFGDNKAGLIPTQSSDILVKFRVPTMMTAEIISGAFNEKAFTSLEGISDNIVVNLKNFTKSEHGYPGDSINDIRKKLPAYVRTQNRAVTGADYKFLTDSFASPYDGVIGKSSIVLRNHGCAGNIIDVIVLAKTGSHRLIKASDTLKASLVEFLTNRKMFTDYLCVKDGAIVSADIKINAFLNKNYKKFEREIKSKITEILEMYFDLSNWEFGQPLKEKDLIKYLSSVKEVKQFDISFSTNLGVEYNSKGVENVIPVKYNEVIRPDNIEINFSYGDE